MTALWPDHLFLVGCGNMAGRMLSRWLACGLDPARLTVLRPSGQPVADGVRVITEYPRQIAPSSVVMLGMKPQQIGEATAGLAPICGAETTIISILAGTPTAQLRGALPDVRNIVRAMPNLPVGVGKGVIALYADPGASAATRAAVDGLMHPLGLVEWIRDEALFNPVTALSGCGPAFLFRFIDALARAGEELGIPSDQAARMALATALGSAEMAACSSDSPAVLADRVASRGGMTREGLDVLDADDRLLLLLTATLSAARDRGEAMASER